MKILTKKINSFFSDLINKIVDFDQKFENIQNKLPEILVLIIYPVLYFFITKHHEPWYDEAQAWQIAKWASYQDILFKLPHLEGHPPFWHLILSIFAKNNFPYELSLKTCSFVFSYLGMLVLLFSSPFKRIINILLPFTFYLFYEFSIISRPYCLILFTFCLLAIFYEYRNKKPLLYFICLCFLSIIHPFSFVFAFGIGLYWLFENIKSKTNHTFNVLYMLFSLFLILLLFPHSDTQAIHMIQSKSIFTRLFYTFLVLPVDFMFSSICFVISETTLNLVELFCALPIGIVFWLLIYQISKPQKNLGLFLVPYSLFALVASKYLVFQHVGIFGCFLIFYLWINFKSIKNCLTGIYKKLFIIFVCTTLTVQIYWTIKTCILDYFYTYSTGRQEAQFIKEYNLDKYKVFIQFDYDTNEDKLNNSAEDGFFVNILAYFNNNFFYNLNNDAIHKFYVVNKIKTKKEVEKEIEEIKKFGYPDVIVGDFDLGAIFKDNTNKKEYELVFTNGHAYIGKGLMSNRKVSNIYVEKSLAKKLNLKTPTLNEDIFKKISINEYMVKYLCYVFEYLDKHFGVKLY